MSITAKAVGSAIWHVGAGLGGRIVGALGTLMLTHYLNPEVVGEVGIAWVLVLTSQTASSAGFGQYVVAHPGAGSSTGFHVTVLSASTVALVSALLLLFGQPLCRLVNAPGAIAFLPGMVAALAILRIAEIPERVLNRELRFRRVALGTSGAEVVFACSALGLAAVGWGGQSIVMANVVRSVFRLVVFSTGVEPAAWLRRGPLNRKQVFGILGFALPLQLAALAALAAAKWSGLAVSVMFGPAALGLYTLAFNLAQIPADNIGESLADVLLPSFARLDPSRRHEALARSMPLVALLVFPLAIGLGIEAYPLISTFFNPRWQAMAPLLTVLAVLGVVYPMGAAVQAFLKASRRPKAVLAFHAGHVLLLLLFMAGLGRMGLRWAALAPGLAGGCYALSSLVYVGRVEAVPVRTTLVGIGRVILACVGMAIAVLIFRQMHGHGKAHGSLGLLAAEVGVGAVTYVVCAFLFAGPQVRDLLASLSRLRENRHPTSGVALDPKLQTRDADG